MNDSPMKVLKFLFFYKSMIPKVYFKIVTH